MGRQASRQNNNAHVLDSIPTKSGQAVMPPSENTKNFASAAVSDSMPEQLVMQKYLATLKAQTKAENAERSLRALLGPDGYSRPSINRLRDSRQILKDRMTIIRREIAYHKKKALQIRKKGFSPANQYQYDYNINYARLLRENLEADKLLDDKIKSSRMEPFGFW